MKRWKVCVYFWNLFLYISFSIRGPCVRKLLTGLIMYIYPLKIKNIVLYCIVRGAITENKQKYLTKSSSTLLVDEEALSLLCFIFLSPLSLKSLFAGERSGIVQQHLQRDGWQLTSDRASGKQPSKYVM